jgi:hypothetical protein
MKERYTITDLLKTMRQQGEQGFVDDARWQALARLLGIMCQHAGLSFDLEWRDGAKMVAYTSMPPEEPTRKTCGSCAQFEECRLSRELSVCAEDQACSEWME